ncbi:hypothetical protein AB205_0143720 [Aquarana catesbeiana]|uniref:Endonuclease/exonuclease/phosphatase domain-containing protein n=1 Tax=Aquarana catesbeiana TaxID=8400 RepID=A0A2G9PTY6_AQUCT|nr:hypothetical protein AB205_0143720 [Aquarana catesbeiana]
MGKLQEMECTLGTAYCPKRGPNYLKKILNRLMDFKGGSVILAGDFNFCLDPRMDSMTNTQRMGKFSLRMLVYVWRAQHPQAKDYTFHSAVHNTHTMVEHRLLEEVSKTSIKIASLSDHAPVILELRPTGTQNEEKKKKLF